MPLASPNTYTYTPGTPVYGGIPTPNQLAPASLRLYDWTDHENPVLVDSMTFDTDIDDLTFTDSTLAAEIGTVEVKQSTESMIYGDFEFGATRFRVRPELNDEDPDLPVWQVLVSCSPYARWAGFPAFENYNAATDGTIPDAFKIEVLNGAGTVIHTFELHDGYAINDTRTVQTRGLSDPIRPLFNVGMMLPWQSARLKLSADINYWFPGVTEDSMHPTDARALFSTNAAIPLMNGRTQINSSLHWYAMPRWPVGYENSAENTALDPNNDANLFSQSDYTGETVSGRAWRASGWDYEPASISGHDWYPGPGGARFDRAHIPTVYALLATDPDYVRPKNNEAIRDMADAWTKAYFNHAFHYVRNPKTFETIPSAQILARGWSYGYSAYYGSGSSYVSGGSSRHINTHGIPNASGWPSADKDGRRHYNGVQYDDQHNYSEPGWGVLLMNSPMHVYSAKHRFASNTMSWLGSGLTDTLNNFGRRQQAWRWLHYAMQWCIATPHDFGFARSDIETMFQTELEALHDNIYVPAVVNNDTAINMRTVRDLGLWLTDPPEDTGGFTWYEIPQTSVFWFYICGTLQLMKQSGMWAAMTAKSSKCNLALLFMVECLDKYSLDFIVDTNGRAEFDSTDHEQNNELSTVVASGNTPVMPTSWADWATLKPAVGSETWTKNAAGDWVERSAPQHCRAQWAFIRRDYFSDVNGARANINEACTAYSGFYTAWRAASQEWAYRIPAHGIILSGA